MKKLFVFIKNNYTEILLDGSFILSNKPYILVNKAVVY